MEHGPTAAGTPHEAELALLGQGQPGGGQMALVIAQRQPGPGPAVEPQAGLGDLRGHGLVEQHFIEGPDAFAFGRVTTTEGQSLGVRQTKASVMQPAKELTEEERDEFGAKLKPFMRQLREHIVNETGPLSLADAAEWLRDQGAPLEKYKKRFGDLIHLFGRWFRIDRG